MRTATVTLRSGEVVRGLVLAGAGNGSETGMDLFFRAAEPDPLTRAHVPYWFNSEGGSDNQVVKSIEWED